MDYRIDQLGIQANTGGAILVEGTWYCPALPEPLITATWSTPGLVETRFSPDALVWVAVVFHGTAAWRNHGLIIFRFCFIEHLSSCAVQLPRLVAGSARQAPHRGLGISSSGTRCAPRVPRAGQG